MNNISIMANNREAPESLNGFFYQRYCCIYYILNDNNFNYVLEEGYEDIDLIEINNQRKIIQVKYYNDYTESLTFGSGLYKVIIANYNKNDIDEITYFAFNNSENIYQKDLVNVFTSKKYYNIGKFILLLIYTNILLNNTNLKGKEKKEFNKKIKKELDFDITDINNISDIYEKNKQKIKNTLNDKYKQAYDFFSDETNCNNYFSKFKLLKGYSYTELNNEIDKKIINKFNTFINTNNDENKELRITLVKNTILNLLTDKMFANIKSDDRKIKSDDIINKITEKIKTYTNPDNLYYELLKQTEQIIINSINKPHIERLNINGYINQIKQIKVESIDNISFYICLLNNYYNELKESDIDYIKIYLINFILSKYKISNDTNNTLIKYLKMVLKRKNNNYKIPHEKLIKLIDDKHIINKFFN